MDIHNYKELIVWQKAMDFALEVYKLSKSFPKDELYSLTNQIRRAAISVPSNIAEGRCRYSKLEFKQFLSISHGSLAETETQILLAIRLGYITMTQAKTALNL
ncbi:MAG TPA: four helix bundle protein, partial [Candidatus Cloacimonadota bacterium]|nr:four helix bundle protein [Candidatus Cloacimonadota bacterium]